MTNHLELYKVFYYTAKSGSITAAAEELSISQPAVSQSVKQLEDILGVKLFIRTSKGIILTREGEALLPFVSRSMDELESGERKLKELLDHEAGEIKIGASDMTLKYYLLPYLEKFHALHPKVKVTVYNSPTPDTLKTLSSNKIDLCIVSTPLPEISERLHIKKVKTINDIFVAGNAYSELKGQTIKFARLSELPLICLEKNTSTRKFMDTFLEEKGVELSPEFELATSDIIVQFAIRNLGIGSVVEDFALESINRGELFKLRLEEELPSREFCLVYKNDELLSPAAKELIRLL